MRNFLSIIILICGLATLQGCLPAAFVSGTAAVGTTLAEERKIGQVFSDVDIRTKINSKWVNHDEKLTEMVEIQVREGRVLLTGIVDSPLRQIDAVRLVWEVPGVKEVLDETRVGEAYSWTNYAKDTWTTTKVKTDLLFEENVQSINYNIKTVDGTVYLIGIAQNQNEIDTAVRKATGISGVKNVVSHMRIKSEPRTDPYRNSNQNSYASGSTVQEGAPIMEQPLTDDYSTSSHPSYPDPRAR